NKSEKFKKSISERNASREYDLKTPGGDIRTTREISQTLETKSGRKNHAVALCAPIDLPDIKLPMDPYTLGAWLGDGTSTSGGLTSIDPEITEKIESAGYFVVHSEKNKTR